MCRVVFIVIGVVAVLTNSEAEGIPDCGRLLHGGLQCCQKDVPRTPPPEEAKECFQTTKPGPSCELEMCIAKKLGLILDDGTLDKEKVTDQTETIFDNDPDLADSIKDNCINGNLTKYGPEVLCGPMNMRICVEVQIIKACDQWNDEGDCIGIEQIAAECITQKYII